MLAWIMRILGAFCSLFRRKEYDSLPENDPCPDIEEKLGEELEKIMDSYMRKPEKKSVDANYKHIMQKHLENNVKIAKQEKICKKVEWLANCHGDPLVRKKNLRRLVKESDKLYGMIVRQLLLYDRYYCWKGEKGNGKYEPAISILDMQEMRPADSVDPNAFREVDAGEPMPY